MADEERNKTKQNKTKQKQTKGRAFLLKEKK